ncbi:hypothetical protein [Streptomyces cinereoruber]|uniref:hypothetical protein n=1 Tax=Streptomyces cinereoruber TaxID=67260 RepID=UPI003C2B616B
MNLLLDTPLSTDQLDLLRHIAEPWIQTGEWPQWGCTQHHFDLDERDAESILRSLPRVGLGAPYAAGYGYTTGVPRPLTEDSTIRLTLAACLALPEMHMAIGRPFEAALQRMVGNYLTAKPSQPGEKPQPTVRSDELREFLINADTLSLTQSTHFVEALPELLSYEPGIVSGSKKLRPDRTWILDITRSVLQYRTVDSIAAYVDRTCQIVTANAAEYITSIPQQAYSHPSYFSTTPTTQETEPSTPPATTSARPPYISLDLLTELETAGAKNTRWRVHKLLALCRELNSNFEAENPYACVALIRAVMDHISPAFGHKDFKQVAGQYKSFSHTDRGHASKLAAYKGIGDDSLHRQIGPSLSTITMNDVPPSLYLGSVLDALVQLLKEPDPS